MLIKQCPFRKTSGGFVFLAPVLLPLTGSVVTVPIGKLTFPKE